MLLHRSRLVCVALVAALPLALVGCKKQEAGPAKGADAPKAVVAAPVVAAAATPVSVPTPAPAPAPASAPAPAPVAAKPAVAPVAAGGLKLQTQTSAELKIGDTTKCPVMGEEFEIESDSDFATYQGKKVFFCCAKKCKKKFEAEPTKYLPAS